MSSNKNWRNPFLPENQFAFSNFSAPMMAGHCWGIARLQSALLSGASFSGPTNSRENVTAKINDLLAGKKVTFNSARNINELTRKYESEIKRKLKSLQRRAFFNPLNFTSGRVIKNSSRGNVRQIESLSKLLSENVKPNLILQRSGLDQHVVFAHSIKKYPNGFEIAFSDPNYPKIKGILHCNFGGDCQVKKGTYSDDIHNYIGIRVADVSAAKRNKEGILSRVKRGFLNVFDRIKMKRTH